jgi:outer membrane receptor protein involved in Fe transport
VFEAGARFEASEISESGDTKKDRSFFYPKPRAVLTWAPDPDTQIRFRYERVLGQLDFNNFIASSNLSATGVTAGNANLRPDQRTQYEFSAERHFWDKGAIVVTLLHEQIKDAVDFVPVRTATSVFDAPGNIGNGRNDEVNITLAVPLDRFGIPDGLLRATNIFRFSDVRDPTTGVHRVISAERPQDIEIRFSQDIASLNSTWGVFYFNAWSEDSFRLEQTRVRRALPPYAQIYWDYKPNPSWSFHFEVDNVFRFIYDDIRHNFAGPRDTFPVSNTDEYRTRSIPQIDFQIRYTFD